MRPGGFISTGVLLLFVGTITPAYAQREQQEEEHGKPQQKQQHQQEKPAQQQHQQPANRPAERPQQTYGGVYHATRTLVVNLFRAIKHGPSVTSGRINFSS